MHVHLSSYSLSTHREMPTLWFWHMIKYLGVHCMAFNSPLYPDKFINLGSAVCTLLHLPQPSHILLLLLKQSLVLQGNAIQARNDLSEGAHYRNPNFLIFYVNEYA